MAERSDPTRITQTLARFVVDSAWTDLAPKVKHEARRATLNWLGCALGGCRDGAVERALAALGGFSGPAQATLLGRGERLDILTTAVLNGLASNILDYDDTHLRTVIHPTVPVAAALLALAEHRQASGAQFLHALALGIEVECRIGNAMSPQHYAAGWHITSTCGVFGAAAACGKLLGLDVQQMTWALGIAATQAAGITGGHGSMSKSYNMGHAARSGLAAALLAAQGFTSAEGALETERGFFHLFAQHPDPAQVVARLGEGWELMGVSYKPYPCGIVAHPVIDACLDMRADPGIDPSAVERIELRAHPLVAMLMSIAAPTTALEAKLSVHHCVAAALLHGRVGVAEFGTACVNDPAVIALRSRVVLEVDETVDKAASDVTLVLRNGSSLRRRVAQASGSLERPLSDAAIEAKFRALAAWGSPDCAADALIDLVWSLERAPDAGALARACTASRTV